MTSESKLPAILCAAVIALGVGALGTFALTRSDAASAQTNQNINDNGGPAGRGQSVDDRRNPPANGGRLIHTTHWEPAKTRVKVVHYYKPTHVTYKRVVYKQICW